MRYSNAFGENFRTLVQKIIISTTEDQFIVMCKLHLHIGFFNRSGIIGKFI